MDYLQQKCYSRPVQIRRLDVLLSTIEILRCIRSTSTISLPSTPLDQPLLTPRSRHTRSALTWNTRERTTALAETYRGLFWTFLVSDSPPVPRYP